MCEYVCLLEKHDVKYIREERRKTINYYLFIFSLLKYENN